VQSRRGRAACTIGRHPSKTPHRRRSAVPKLAYVSNTPERFFFRTWFLLGTGELQHSDSQFADYRADGEHHEQDILSGSQRDQGWAQRPQRSEMTLGAALRPPAPGPLRVGAALSQDCTYFAALVCDATDSRIRAHQRPRAARRTRAPSLGLALVTLMGAACVPRLQPCGARPVARNGGQGADFLEATRAPGRRRMLRRRTPSGAAREGSGPSRGWECGRAGVAGSVHDRRAGARGAGGGRRGN
jgi:hypothetical protein